VTKDLGKRWELDQIALRLWPSASSIQGMKHRAVRCARREAVQAERHQERQNPPGADRVQSSRQAVEVQSQVRCVDSAHYTAAIIIQDHVLTLDQFTPERYDDPAIRKAAAELIDIQPDESLKDVQATVEFELADGTKIAKRCEFPRGSFENRLTPGQIETKLRTYARAGFRVGGRSHHRERGQPGKSRLGA